MVLLKKVRIIRKETNERRRSTLMEILSRVYETMSGKNSNQFGEIKEMMCLHNALKPNSIEMMYDRTYEEMN